MKKFTSIAAALLLSVATFAQVPPQGFSYQAVVRDAQNNIVANQSVTVEITILQGSNDIDALPVYNETHFKKTDQNGMLTLTVGKGETTGSFLSINWGKNNCYMRTKVYNGNTVYGESDKVQLMSVPYALYAGNASNAANTEINFNNISTENYTTLISNLDNANIAQTLGLVKQDELSSYTTNVLKDYALKTELPTTQNLSNYVSKTELAQYVTTETLNDDFATKDTLEYYVLKSVYNTKVNELTTEINQLKSQLASLTSSYNGQTVSAMPVKSLNVFVTKHVDRVSQVSSEKLFEVTVYGQTATQNESVVTVPAYSPLYLIIKVHKDEYGSGKNHEYSLTSVKFGDTTLTYTSKDTQSNSKYDIYTYMFGPVLSNENYIQVEPQVKIANEIVN